MKISCDSATAAQRRYTPIALGNGDLSLLLDPEGGMGWQEESCHMAPVIFRAGSRYDNPRGELVPWGSFRTVPEAAGSPVEWEQEFDTDRAFCRSRCRYGNGTVVETEAFCHLRQNGIALHKRIVSGPRLPLVLEYSLDSRRMTVESDGEGTLCYTLDAGEIREGAIRLAADRPVERVESKGRWQLLSRDAECTFFLMFDEPGTPEWDALLASHTAAWAEYWRESTLQLAGDRLTEVARMAEYHLRITTTRWSIPVGIYQTHWQGKYFGFDEFFALGGLLAAGHVSTASRVPDFRFDGLRSACERVEIYFGKRSECARYPWISLENPCLEGAAPGSWMDHFFHLSHISMSCWNYFQASGDREYLREKIRPVLRGCAEFFRQFLVRETRDGKTVIDKCTDLERLGAGRENAYMTTCGAIATLRAAADASDLLDLEPELAALWRQTADALQRDLPKAGDRYTPYPGCPESSIALLSGTFPYPVIPAEDPFQRNAIDDFCANESAAGNMYPVGKKLCTWYLGWKAIVFLRLGRTGEAEALLRSGAEATGCLSEIYEIYELGMHPWFTTAEGVFLQAVIELQRKHSGR